ncbi:MAG: response regulator, partial [Candidatus Polarisedimenticolia bacterium]
ADVAPDRPAPRRAPRGSESILVVEDEAALRDLAVRVLGAAGYRVRAAADADEALALAGREGAPALLLTDVVMPRMDGRELARRFRETAPDAKVLFMSGYTDDALLRSGEFPPGVALLPKPFAPAALLEAVRRALDGVR